MPRLKKIALITALVTTSSGALAAGLWGERLAARWARDKAEQVLRTNVEFSKLRIDLSAGGVTMENLRVHHPDRKGETLGEIPKMTLRLKSFSDLLADDIPVAIQLERPRIVFVTTRGGDWELTGRIPLIRRGEGEGRLAPFNIDRISVQDGQLEFRDGRMGTTIRLSKIDFSADDFRLPSPGDPLPVEFQARFVVGSAGEMRMKGQGDFLSPKTSLRAELKAEGLSLPPYAPYYERGLPVHVRGGRATFTAQVQCDQDALRVPIHAEVSGLKVELKKNKSLGFVADYQIDSMKNERGMVEADLLVTGDLRRPQIAFLTKFDASMSVGMKAVGSKIKSGFGKVKGFFTK